jgi:hypothetical protein
MPSRNRILLLLATTAITTSAACSDDSSSTSDGSQCVGPKCDDIDDPSATASAGDTGPIEDPPDPRADLGVDPPAQCDGACSVLAGCLGETLTDCQLECTTARDDASGISTTCVTAYDAVLACIAALDCAAAADYQAAVEGYPCATEEDAAFVACTEAPSGTECDAFCALAVTCDGGEAETCAALCRESLANAEILGTNCRAAQLAAFECVAALDCESYAAWSAADGDDYPCAASDAALVDACMQEGEG